MRAVVRRHVSSKSPTRVQDRDKGVAGVMNKIIVKVPIRGSLICPPGKFMIILDDKKNKKLS